MSAFGIGTNAERADSGLLAGRQIKIACKAWFTSTGAIQPLNHVTVRFREEKYYSGIPSMEYVCRAVIGGLTQEFKLIFFPEEGRWVMVLPE